MADKNRHILMVCFLFMTRLAFSADCNWRDLTGKDTFDLYLADTIVGTLVQTVEYDEKSVTTIVAIAMSMAGSGNRLEVKEQRRYNVCGSMVSAYLEISGPSGVNSWTVKKDNGQWNSVVIVGGVKTTRKPGDIGDNLSSMCRLIRGIKSLSIKEGETWYDTAFEMMSAQNVVTKVCCVGVDTARHIWTFENIDDCTNRTEKQQLDGNGRVIEESVSGIYVAKNRNKRLAVLSGSLSSTGLAAVSPEKRPDLSELFSIASDRARTPEERVAVTGDDSGLTMDSSVARWYSHKGKLWVLCNFPTECLSAGAPPLQEPFRPWLRPTITMQCDNPKIRELSNKLRGDAKDACALINSFTRYVYTTLQKRNTATFSNALETLNAGFGDCGEHAVVLGALLRAAGVPARIVLGLVYVESKKAYMYHAWVMARAGEWVFADAALGAFPASGNYVPLIIDDTGGNAMRILKMVGKMRIEYVKEDGK
ncbi:MAG: transglutaminase family protein [Chitinivibrionales bacterium]